MIQAHHVTASEPRPRHGLAYISVILAILAGAIIGWASPHLGVALKPLGDAFVKLIKMMIGPVIFLTVSSGIAGMKDLREVRGVAIKALLYFFFFSTLALIIGLCVANVVHPGAGMNVSPASLNAAPIEGYINKSHSVTIVGFLTEIIPETPISAFADGNILQILFFAVLFGVSLVMAGRRGEIVLGVLDSANAVVFKVVGIIMKAAPVGAFGAMAFTIGKYGVASLANLAGLVACFYITSALFVVVVLGTVCKACGFSIFRLLGYLREELLIVLGTSSSEAALPSLMQKLEALGCEKGIVGLVVPTGYSFNLDGTNIYMTLAALFIAQATGVHLNVQQQVVLLLVAMLSSKGAAGVTGAGFITLAATLAVVPAVPVAGMALILGVDRFMSECRAITNVIGNGVATIVVSRWEDALDTQRFSSVLSGGGRVQDRPTPQVETGASAGLAI